MPCTSGENRVWPGVQCPCEPWTYSHRRAMLPRPVVVRTYTGAWLVKGSGPTRRYRTYRQALRCMAARIYRRN